MQPVDTPKLGKVSTDQKVLPLGRRGAGQHHSGARKGKISCCISSEHKKTKDLDFIPESPYQNLEEDK